MTLGLASLLVPIGRKDGSLLLLLHWLAGIFHRNGRDRTAVGSSVILIIIIFQHNLGPDGHKSHWQGGMCEAWSLQPVALDLVSLQVEYVNIRNA